MAQQLQHHRQAAFSAPVSIIFTSTTVHRNPPRPRGAERSAAEDNTGGSITMLLEPLRSPLDASAPKFSTRRATTSSETLRRATMLSYCCVTRE